MSTIEHRSTAKATIRDLLEAYGTAGTLALLGEVVGEKLPSRKGRPTREEAVARLVTKTIGTALPGVITLEGKALNAKAAREG
ncbi:MAG: hypothetical protein EBT03_09400 [Betaproteobacteria bacterium]|nr:hypothetical protein [Betaproteobacteria bacterium]NCA17243.1 hypothetical protein [Betaproteobacteria bacterium]